MKIKALSFYVFLILITLFIACDKKSTHDFPPLDKRYWTVEDFENATGEIKYNYNAEEELPTFSNPETKPILDKLLDTQNFKVILEDNELGLKYKNEIATNFFETWQNIINPYGKLDKRDKYLYENEYIAIIDYGLQLQLYYFRLGNEEIKNSTEDYSTVQSTIESNVNTLINNFTNYLDEINKENSYSENGKKLLAKTINKNFSSLINENPNADFSNLKQKMEVLIKKTNNSEIKSSLEVLIKLIDSKKSENKKPEIAK